MSKDMVYEDVPRLVRRSGDNLVASQNNSTIVLGRDRLSTVDTGYGSSKAADGGKSAGAIHLSVGRKTENPSTKDDAATVYVSAKSDPDEQAGTTAVGSERKAASAVVLRADCMRISARTDIKLSVGKAFLTMASDGKIVVDGDIQLGETAVDRMIRGDAFAKYWSSPAHTHPTPAGLSGPPQPMPDNLLSPRNRVG